MPASIVHMLLSRQVRKTLRKDGNQEIVSFANDVLHKHSHFMELGSLGPDLPYFGPKSLWNPHRPVGVDQWSYQLHSRNPNDFPLRMIELAWRQSDPKTDDWSESDKCKFAFLCGFLTHVAADQVIHPVVNIIAGRYSHSHAARDKHRHCEIHQDLYMLSQQKYEGGLTTFQFRSERFHRECDIRYDEDVGDLGRDEFLYFIQKAFVESHAVTPKKAKLERRIRFLRWAMWACRYQSWYTGALKNLFTAEGDLRQDGEQHQEYILLKDLPGIEIFEPKTEYRDFFDEASRLAVLYIRAAHQLYRTQRLDDDLRAAFLKVVVNADLGCPLQLHILDEAMEALPCLEKLVDKILHD